jgi:predicted enzyme related to lactoylglutathione lyase
MHNPVVHWEMLSKDPDKVAGFYENLFGWKIQNMPELNYRVVDTGAEAGVNGGIFRPDKPEPWPGNLTMYVNVDDLAAYRKKITEAGGKILIEEQDVPGMGSLSLFTDPDGRMMGLWKAKAGSDHPLAMKNAIANIAVKDIRRAKKFYAETLGLREVDSEGEELVVFMAGHSRLIVYHSEFAGTNKATAATWVVGEDVEGVVRTLKAKGVKFEHYDMPDLKREGDVHVGDGMKVAWFKDPDGNILNIVSG